MANKLFTAVKKFFKKEPDNGPIKPVNTDGGKATVDAATNMFFSSHYWYTDPKRKATHADIDNMDDNDELVSQALDTLADTAIGFDKAEIHGFYIHSENENVKKILDAMVYRTNLTHNAWQIIRRMVKYGNEFQEIGYAKNKEGNLEIVSLTGDINEATFEANLSPTTGRVDAAFPWIQKLDTVSGNRVTQFSPFDIVHFSYGEKRKNVAVPILTSARRNWKRLQLIEDLLAFARMVRAYVKFVHKIPVESDDEPSKIRELVDSYKEKISKKKFSDWSTGKSSTIDAPLSVDTDFYIPDDGSGRGGIETIDPKNSQLESIDDVNYHRGRLIARLGVPKKYLNIAEDGDSKGGSEHEERHFARKVKNIQNQFVLAVTYICTIELILKGLNPRDEANRFAIGMAPISADDAYRSAQAFNTNATALNSLLQVLELPESYITDKVLGLTDYERTQYKGQIKIRTTPNPVFVNQPDAGGRPTGRSAGSNDNNGKAPVKDR